MSCRYEVTRVTTNLEVCLVKAERLCKEIARTLSENPHCFDDNPRKSEAIQMVISHLDFKIERSKAEEEVKPNRKSAIVLSTLVDCFDEGKNREYARKVMENLFDMSIQELKYVPSETKERAFEICKQLLEGKI